MSDDNINKLLVTALPEKNLEGIVKALENADSPMSTWKLQLIVAALCRRLADLERRIPPQEVG